MPTNLMEQLLLAMADCGIDQPSVSFYFVATSTGATMGISLYERSRFVRAFSDKSMETCLRLAIAELTEAGSSLKPG